MRRVYSGAASEHMLVTTFGWLYACVKVEFVIKFWLELPRPISILSFSKDKIFLLRESVIVSFHLRLWCILLAGGLLSFAHKWKTKGKCLRVVVDAENDPDYLHEAPSPTSALIHVWKMNGRLDAFMNVSWPLLAAYLADYIFERSQK